MWRMNAQYLPYLVCPFCQQALTLTGNMLLCPAAHTFDLAREGYVYFLRKKLPGDTREMLLARRQFFAHGHYRPLADFLQRQLVEHLANRQSSSPLALLDAGCGEGYYLSNLLAYLSEAQLPVHCIGLDVSKEAVRLAARYCPEAFFLVSNLWERLPFAPGVFDALLSIFAPRNPQEFARILAPGGLLLVLLPAPAHLQSLRLVLHLLAIEEQKEQHVIAQFTEQGAFLLEATRSLTYEIALQPPEIEQLVMMTPNYWHVTEETRQALALLTAIRTEVACTCLVFRRQSAG